MSHLLKVVLSQGEGMMRIKLFSVEACFGDFEFQDLWAFDKSVSDAVRRKTATNTADPEELAPQSTEGTDYCSKFSGVLAVLESL